MVKMSTLKQIKALEKKRDSALDKMLSAKLIAPGSYRQVYCRCGKKNYWCYSGKGHPYRRITFSEDGKSRTKSISEKNTGWIKKLPKIIGILKKARRRLRNMTHA